MPGTARFVERFSDGEEEFFFKGPADDLHADRKTFLGKADRDRGAGKAGGQADSFVLDVAKRERCRDVAALVHERVGPISILVNNAGINRRNAITADPQAVTKDWEDVLAINLNGVFNVTHAFLAQLRASRGRIVNIASVTALTGQGSSMAYAASKGGMITLTKSLARALAPGVRVNAGLPGLVRTHFADWPPSAFDKAEKITPLRRLATVEDVAQATLFFAARALGTTGETLVIDGGASTLGTGTAEFAPPH